ncbi:MAG: FFLEELY motif protein, partial [Wenzhouxiangella sp.]
RYLPACEFFLDELYGGRDFVERDRQLMRAAPVMRRFLPDHLLAAVGDAMQLQAVSQQFDLALAELLCDVDPITQPDYARAYREQADWEGREHQLSLIRELGELLGQTVQRPLVHRLIRLMHGPAVLAGFGMLQVFLRDGLDAFAEMGPADHFLDTISAREHAGLEAMREGSDWPFERWIGHGP